MNFLKTSLRNFEQEHGRNVESRRFINFLLRGGMMAGTPPRQTQPQHIMTDAPISVLSIGNSQTNKTALAFKKMFQPLFQIQTYDVIRASEFFGNSKPLTPPYTHIIITGHCHSKNGRLEDDAGNQISIVGMLERINEMQDGTPYKIIFYNCQAYQRIFQADHRINTLLLKAHMSQAYFANEDVVRYMDRNVIMTIAKIRTILSRQQVFVQWSNDRPPFSMQPTNMFDVAAMFFGKPVPTEDQIDELQRRLDVQTKKRKSDDVEHDDTDDKAGGASKQQRPSQEEQAQSQTSSSAAHTQSQPPSAEEHAQSQLSSSAAQGLSPSFNGEGQSHIDMSLEEEEEDKGQKSVSRNLFF